MVIKDIRWIWLVPILAGLPLFAGAADQKSAPSDGHYQDIYQLPVWIEAAASYCRWKSAGGSGYVRVIQTREAPGQGMYLQWIRHGIAGGADEAVSTLAITELTGKQALQYQMPTETLGRGQCTLNALAQGVEDGRRYDIELVLKAPGDYQYRLVKHMNAGF
ncbi:hypothetical protein [Oceanobacter mangrovi]|uniref:hypothetical protein n=1 Tax=Oceanobacter mangrovi TaxID=2862510 RepID=UPI001C8E225F|nr:hypothetical protein [Oceanobacter mangrovi]